MKALEHHSWAVETFGRAKLGHFSRTRRLIGIAAGLAQAPAGTVTGTFRESAEREGAFRFLSNPKVSSAAIAQSTCSSTLARCAGTVYCAVDGASISLSDRSRVRDVGRIGSWSLKGRGLYAVTTLAVDKNGCPIGLCGIEWWARTKPSASHNPHLAPTRESAHTIAILNRIADAQQAEAPHARLWFQLDRGFDGWTLFRLARDRGLLITVRANYNRRLRRKAGSRQTYLWNTIRRAPVAGWYCIDLPAKKGRPARTARLRIRVAKASLVLQSKPRQIEHAEVNVVFAQEEGYRGSDRIEWMLHTTAPTATLRQACDVVDGYTTRWRIEELHREWKRGWCNVERTQLRQREALCKWATLHLAVAARALRLVHLSRTKPDVPSTTEFTRDEIDAAILLKKKRTNFEMGDTPTLGEVVRMVADLGGYTGKSSGGPPGATIIGRGLDYIAPLAEGLRIMRSKEK